MKGSRANFLQQNQLYCIIQQMKVDVYAQTKNEKGKSAGEIKQALAMHPLRVRIYSEIDENSEAVLKHQKHTIKFYFGKYSGGMEWGERLKAESFYAAGNYARVLILRMNKSRQIRKMLSWQN